MLLYTCCQASKWRPQAALSRPALTVGGRSVQILSKFSMLSMLRTFGRNGEGTCERRGQGEEQATSRWVLSGGWAGRWREQQRQRTVAQRAQRRGA